MSWLCALLAVCSVFTTEAWLLRHGQSRSVMKSDIWEKFRQSLKGLPSGDKWAVNYQQQLNINHVCKDPNRVDLCQRILQNYQTGELREVLRDAFYESSIRGRDLMEIVFESLMHSEGLSIPQAREQSQTAFWKYVFAKLPYSFIDDVVEALQYDLSRTCTPEEIHYLLTPSKDNVPSVVGEMHKQSQIYDAERANYHREKYGRHSTPNDRFIPKGQKWSYSHRSELH